MHRTYTAAIATWFMLQILAAVPAASADVGPRADRGPTGAARGRAAAPGARAGTPAPTAILSV